MFCRYFYESAMSVRLCNYDKQLKCMPHARVLSVQGTVWKLSLLILISHFVTPRYRYQYPRITIWLQDGFHGDLPGCYVATSTIPTAIQERSKFASRSVAWGLQRWEWRFSTLRWSNFPQKQATKHLLHVFGSKICWQELQIHGLFMTYDSLLKQILGNCWWGFLCLLFFKDHPRDMAKRKHTNSAWWWDDISMNFI